MFYFFECPQVLGKPAITDKSPKLEEKHKPEKSI
jgi:hypothetical protein